MRVMVIGKGGREHAIVWKLAQSSSVKKIYALPGNAGINEIAEPVDVSPSDIPGIIEAADSLSPSLVVVGPEEPLFLGVTDALSEKHFLVFGPTKKASLLEREKAFAKRFMAKHKIPTAPFEIFNDPNKAKDYIKTKKTPLVVKASGPAFGKGSKVCFSQTEARNAVEDIMIRKIFGASGSTVVIEDYLEGEEASVMILTDGKNYIPLLCSQDHKRAYDRDRGPNTGGMGAYAPIPLVDEDTWRNIQKRIIEPLFEGLEKEGILFKGILYLGLMINEKNPFVLEFNVRFGDPETQPVLFLLKSDLFSLLYEASSGNLSTKKIEWEKGYAVCTVLASGGYPGRYEKGKKITIGEIEDDVYIFHAGTKKIDEELFTDGGRVMGVTAKASTLEEAKNKVYRNIQKIYFENMHYRRDIADKGIRRLHGV